MLEFLYDCLKSKDRDFLFDRLSRDDFQKINSQAKIKSFVSNSNIEDKILLLSKLNYGCGIVFWDNEKVKTNRVQDILLAHTEVEEKDMVKTIIKGKVYATMTIDILKSMQTISKASNSTVYSVNRKFLEISNHNLKTRTLATKLEADANLTWLVSLLDKAYGIEPMLEQFKLNLFHFRILLHLQNCPNGSTPEAIKNKIGCNVAAKISSLRKMNMVRYSSKKVIHIDAMGIMVIDQVLSKL